MQKSCFRRNAEVRIRKIPKAPEAKSPLLPAGIGGVARSAGVVLCQWSVNPFQDFAFEIIVFLYYFLLDQKVAKKSSRTEAVSGKISLGQHSEKASLRLEM